MSSIPPVLYLDIQLSSPILTSQTLTPEQQVDQAEAVWLEKASHLPSQKQQAYKSQVRRMANELRQQLTYFPALKNDSQAIQARMHVLLRDFNNASDLLHTNTLSFNQATIKLTLDQNNLSETIKSTQLTFTRLSRKPVAEINMTERKTKLAQCVQRMTALDSPGATIECWSEHSKGMTPEQKKELADEILPIGVGTVASAVAAPFALVSRAMSEVNRAIGVAVVINGCLSADPFSYKGCVVQARDVIEGRDKKFNATVKESMPLIVLKLAEKMALMRDRIQGFDDYMTLNYYTPRGLMLDAGQGVTDIVFAGITSSAARVGKEMVLGSLRMAKLASQTETFTMALLMARRDIPAFARSEFGGGKIFTDRERLIKFAESMGFKEEKKRGKGSHKLWTKDGCKPLVIPKDKELALGTARNIQKLAEQGLNEKTLIQAIEAPKSAPQLKGGIHNRPLPHRIDYSQNYFHEGKEFITVKEFNGYFRRDVTVLQYHSSDPLGKRTYKWFMPATQGNILSTTNAVRDAVAKLIHYGDVTHVSLARIPAGEPVRFLHGPAVGKLDPNTNMMRPGGGTQYRFFDFDPNWIIKTQELPK